MSLHFTAAMFQVYIECVKSSGTSSHTAPLTNKLLLKTSIINYAQNISTYSRLDFISHHDSAAFRNAIT